MLILFFINLFKVENGLLLKYEMETYFGTDGVLAIFACIRQLFSHSSKQPRMLLGWTKLAAHRGLRICLDLVFLVVVCRMTGKKWCALRPHAAGRREKTSQADFFGAGYHRPIPSANGKGCGESSLVLEDCG